MRRDGLAAVRAESCEGAEGSDELAADYDRPQYHVSYLTAVARRVRKNYLWILLIQTLAYAGKITVHPYPAASVRTFVDRAEIGPIPGLVVLALGALYILTWTGLALWVTRAYRAVLP